MGNVGVIPATAYESSVFEDLGSVSGTSHALTYSVASAADIIVYIDNVAQEPDIGFTVSGSTLTTATLSSNEVYVRYLGLARQTVVPPASSLTAAMMTSGMVTGQSNATVTASDKILLSDADDSDNLKEDTIQGILDLVTITGWVKLSTATASASTSVDFDNLFSSTYDQYMVVIHDARPSTSTSSIRCRAIIANAIDTTSLYDFAVHGAVSNGTANAHNSEENQNYMDVIQGCGSGTNENGDAFVELSKPLTTDRDKRISFRATTHAGANAFAYSGGGRLDNAAAWTGISFHSSSTYITGGTFTLYGLTK